MSVQNTTSSSMPTQEEMLSRYQKAQFLMRGINTKTVTFNSAVFPIWIRDSDCFWYERQSREGNLSNVQLAVTAVVFDDELLVIGVILLEADIGSQLVVLGLDPVVVPLWLVAAHRTDGEVAEEV